MKVAVIHNHPIHYKHLLFRELARRCIDLEVIFLASGSQIRHEEIRLSQDLYKYRVGFDGPYEAAPAALRSSFVWHSLRAIRPDVVIIGGYYAIECWVAWLWARVHGLPIIMWFESNRFDHRRYWLKELPKRVFVRGIAAAHVYGKSHREYLLRLGMRPQSITLKRAVVDVTRFDTSDSQRSYSGNGRRRLLYVGRLATEKNLSFLLRAFARANGQLRGSELFLTIAGTGSLDAQLREECAILGIESAVEFTGYCPQTELRALCLKSDFLILPSLREPWGLVSLEGMLCRMPVIISDRCGCAEDVITPDSGWRFSPFDEDQLVDLLVGLLEVQSEELARMGNAARALALDYSPSACADRIVQSIREISESHSCPRTRYLT